MHTRSAHLWNSKTRRRDHYCALRVTFGMRSQMPERTTLYPLKMAALVVCHLSLMAVLVWAFR